MSITFLSRHLASRAAGTLPSQSYPLAGANGSGLETCRRGGVVNLDGMTTKFLQIAGETLFEGVDMSNVVQAYGRISDGDFVIHRFYFDRSMLQVVAGSDGKACAGETKLFNNLAEINPSTPEEWDLWLEGVDGGQPLLTSPSMLWQNTVVFERFWSPGNGPTEAKQFVETIDDGSDVPSVITNSAMLFNRELKSGLSEWLQVAVCQTGEERWIEVYVGLNAEPGEFSILI